MLRSGWGVVRVRVRVLMTGGELWSKNFCPELWVTPAQRLCHNNIELFIHWSEWAEWKYNFFFFLKINFQLVRHILTFVTDPRSKVFRASCAVNFQSFAGWCLCLFEEGEDDGDCYAVNLAIYCLSTNWEYNRSTTMVGNYRPTKLWHFKQKPYFTFSHKKIIRRTNQFLEMFFFRAAQNWMKESI